jgi:hypothetical protein
MNADETKELILGLKKNYGLEEILGLRYGAGDIRSIFKLNRAGRRYLVQDGSSISKGVEVLSGVSNDINSVFLHLLENPRLCDRGAVEMSNSIGILLRMPGRRIQGITVVEGESSKPRHTRTRNPLGDWNERLYYQW